MKIKISSIFGFVLAALIGIGTGAVAANVATSNMYRMNAAAASANAFDEFGYNYKARIFVGKADGVDRSLDGTVWGDAEYANDHLVMRWSKAWDDARFHGADWGPDAWEDNEWNGMVKGGSQTTEHAKIIWVGPEGKTSKYWREGGQLIWGQFEIIMDQGMDHGERYSNAHAIPTGYGGN